MNRILEFILHIAAITLHFNRGKTKPYTNCDGQHSCFCNRFSFRNFVDCKQIPVIYNDTSTCVTNLFYCRISNGTVTLLNLNPIVYTSSVLLRSINMVKFGFKNKKNITHFGNNFFKKRILSESRPTLMEKKVCCKVAAHVRQPCSNQKPVH